VEGAVEGKIILGPILPIAGQNGNCQSGKIWQNSFSLFYDDFEMLQGRQNQYYHCLSIVRYS
jgi:hypothetical protein